VDPSRWLDAPAPRNCEGLVAVRSEAEQRADGAKPGQQRAAAKVLLPLRVVLHR
jgi:hypothetical protein